MQGWMSCTGTSGAVLLFWARGGVLSSPPEPGFVVLLWMGGSSVHTSSFRSFREAGAARADGGGWMQGRTPPPITVDNIVL